MKKGCPHPNHTLLCASCLQVSYCSQECALLDARVYKRGRDGQWIPWYDSQGSSSIEEEEEEEEGSIELLNRMRDPEASQRDVIEREDYSPPRGLFRFFHYPREEEPEEEEEEIIDEDDPMDSWELNPKNKTQES